MKLVVVGGVAGGASAAARVRRIDPKAEIVMFERGEHVAFSNCALPYHLSGTVEDSASLVLMDPVRFKNQHDIDARVLSEVTAINRDEKTVTVKNLVTGEEYREAYDKLVLAPGASPVMPKSIKGIDGKNVFSVRNVTDIVKLKKAVDDAENVTVVGAGFIGIEVVENLKKAGKNVTLIEGLDQILSPFDYDMAQTLHKELVDNGVNLCLSSTVTEIGDGFVKAKSGDEEFSVDADAVVMAIGVAPETKLAVDAGLEIGETRGIKVNHNYQTSDPDIYAVGDAVELYSMLTHSPGRLALAGPAQRQARAAADHMYGKHHNNNGYIGSSCIRVFSQNAACTGLNEKAAKQAGYTFDSVLIYPNDRVGLMPGASYMGFKLVFEVPTGKILGAQAIGKGDAVRRADIIATLISMGGTLEDLKELELCYAPVFGTAKDVTNMAAFVALNILYGNVKQVHVTEVNELVRSGAFIVDVREKAEYELGHLNGALNIPLSELRKRFDEIPKDRPVYLHCRSSQRSYYAICCLKGNGFDNVVNISGSYLGISLYEYYNNKIGKTEKILDNYNFN